MILTRHRELKTSSCPTFLYFVVRNYHSLWWETNRWPLVMFYLVSVQFLLAPIWSPISSCHITTWRRTSKDFMGHAIRLSKTFKLVGNGNPHSSGEQTIAGNIGAKNVAETPTKIRLAKQPSRSSQLQTSLNPSFLFELHHSNGFRHFLRYCQKCPHDEKKGLLRLRAKKVNTGQSRLTRSQNAAGKPYLSTTKETSFV